MQAHRKSFEYAVMKKRLRAGREGVFPAYNPLLISRQQSDISDLGKFSNSICTQGGGGEHNNKARERLRASLANHRSEEN